MKVDDEIKTHTINLIFFSFRSKPKNKSQLEKKSYEGWSVLMATIKIDVGILVFMLYTIIILE